MIKQSGQGQVGQRWAPGLVGLALAAAVARPLGAAPAAPAADIRRDAAVEAIERVMPSVVSIGTKTRVELRGYYYDWWRDHWAPFSQEAKPRESAGAGLIIDESGYVVTNGHVAAEATEIWVNVEGQIVQASLIQVDAAKDLAVLKLQRPAGTPFKAARFAADDDLLLGETVLALGNPFALGGSVSRGILSSKMRRTPADARPDTQLQIGDWLQTDASINPGNSGGPLINLRGEVIGINVAILKEAQGIGFAIPIKRVGEALAEIFTPEAFEQLWFGARLQASRPPLRVTVVQPGSPADRAGLKADDLIRAIDDEVPRGFIDFNDRLLAAGDRRPVTLRVTREGQTREVSVRLVPEKSFFNADLIRRRTGLTLQPLTADLADNLRLQPGAGLLVAGVDRGSPAAEAGLQRGGVVQVVDGRPASDLVATAKQLHDRKAGEKIELTLLVQRDRGLFVQRGTVKVPVALR